MIDIPTWVVICVVFALIVVFWGIPYLKIRDPEVRSKKEIEK
jgi:hypothetical protein